MSSTIQTIQTIQIPTGSSQAHIQYYLDHYTGVVQLPPQVIEINSIMSYAGVNVGLIVRSNTTLIGVKDKTIIKEGPSLTKQLDVVLLVEENAQNVQVQDLTIEGVTPQTRTGLSCAGGYRDVKFLRVHIHNCFARSLMTNSGSETGVRIQVEDSRVTAGRDKGIQVRFTEDAVVSNCFVQMNSTIEQSASLYEVSHSEKIIIKNCLGEHMEGGLDDPPGLRTVNNSSDVVWTGNIVKYGGNGIFCSNSTHIRYINNTLISTKDASKILAVRDGTTVEITLKDNYIEIDSNTTALRINQENDTLVDTVVLHGNVFKNLTGSWGDGPLSPVYVSNLDASADVYASCNISVPTSRTNMYYSYH
jgi:hypothetical protein